MQILSGGHKMAVPRVTDRNRDRGVGVERIL